MLQNMSTADLAAKSGPSRGEGSDTWEAGELVARILSSLEDNKAENVVSIDLQGKSDVADYMVIASGRSKRQVIAICERLVERLDNELKMSVGVEGKQHGDWVLIDAGDVIVHLFRPEVREFYKLEKLWMTPMAEQK